MLRTFVVLSSYETNINRFSPVGLTQMLQSEGHGKIREKEEEIHNCPCRLLEEVGWVGPDRACCRMNYDCVARHQLTNLLIPSP